MYCVFKISLYICRVKHLNTYTMTIQLQSIGKVPAQQASNIKVGTILMWNFGTKETVLEIVNETAKTLSVKIQSGNYVGVRKLNKTRLVCIVN